MKFYKENNNLFLISDIASAVTEISSVVGHIQNFIISNFPKNYFKHIRVETGESFVAQNVNDLYNENLNKIRYPAVSIIPEVMMDNPIDVIRLLPRSGSNVMVYKNLRTSYPCLARDPEDRFSIYYTYSPMTINVNFKITLNSFVQVMNCGTWLRTKFQDGMFKYFNDRLINIEVPKTYIKIIAQILGKLDSNGGFVENGEEFKDIELFLSAISKSEHQIVKKKDLTTSKIGFYFAEKENLLTLFTDLDVPSQVIRDQGVESEYEINFKVQTTFNLIDSFIMSVNNEVFKPVLKNSALVNEIESGLADDGVNFLQTAINMTILADYKDTVYMPNEKGEKTNNIGQNIVHEVYTYDGTRQLSELDLTKILQPDLLRVHAFARDNGFDLHELLYIQVQFKYFDTAYEVDYDKLLVTFTEPIRSEFILNVYLNNNAYHVLLNAMKKNSFYFSQNAMSSLSAVYLDGYDDNGKEILSKHKIRIYKFANLTDQYKRDIDKSLRIMTIYGVGYIGLVPEDDIKASDVKICIGYDSFNKPIIRALELVDSRKKKARKKAT